MMWIAIYILFGWQWNHGLMLWWRFHCTGKYIPMINYQCHSDPSAVLKRLPWDLAWDDKVSCYLLSFTYPRQAITWLCPLRRPTAWKRVTFPPDGVIGIEAREGWRDSGLCYRPRHKWADMCCAERGSDWLWTHTWPHTMEVWTGKIARKGNKAGFLSWVKLRTSAECTKLWLSHPCSQKEL